MNDSLHNPVFTEGLRVVASLLIVVGVVMLTAMLVRRGGVRLNKPRALQVVERLGLAKGTSLWLIEVDGRRLLIGSAEKSLQLLTAIEPQPAAEPEVSETVTTSPALTPIGRELGSFDAAVRAWLGRSDERAHG
jgi:flagellar biogenesis protein FliO